VVSAILTVIQPPIAARLTTINAVRDQVVLPDGVSDIMVGEWIDQASSAISSYCQRSFGRQVLKQTFRGATGDVLILDAVPISSIQEVRADGSVVDASGYDVSLGSGLLYRLANDARVPWAAQRVEVTFQAGWILPGASSRNLPFDIERACLLIVSASAAGSTRDPMLRSETIEGVGSASWIASAEMGSLPPQAEALLRPYSKTVIA
jgi:hypothetical protein